MIIKGGKGSVSMSIRNKNKLRSLISEAVKIDLVYGIPTSGELEKMGSPGASVPVSVDELPVVYPPEEFSAEEKLDLLGVIKGLEKYH